MKIEKFFLIVSAIVSVSYYVHEFTFCRVMGIPLALISFDVARATVISLAGLLIIGAIYFLGYWPTT